MSRDFDLETGGHGGDVSAAIDRWRPGGDLLDFSSNVNPLGPPSGLNAYLRRVLPEIKKYPPPQARELRDRLAGALNVPRQRLLVGNGANELIHLLMLWKRPRRVLVPAPSFSEYERAAILCGAAVESFPLPPERDFDPGVPMGKLAKGDLLVFCNPNNPTGMFYSREKLLGLAASVEKRGALLLIDESFLALAGLEEASLRDLPFDRLWVAVSFTKLWCLPGLRLGAIIGPAGDIGVLSRWGDPWRVNVLAQKAGLYCLEQKDYLGKALALIEKERRFLVRRFEQTGAFKAFNSSANFILFEGLRRCFHVSAYQACLARRGVLVRRADNFCGLDHRYFRIAVRRRFENRRLFLETERCLEGETKYD